MNILKMYISCYTNSIIFNLIYIKKLWLKIHTYMSCHFIDFESIKDATKANIEVFYPHLIHMKNSHINIKKKKLIKTTK